MEVYTRFVRHCPKVAAFDFPFTATTLHTCYTCPVEVRESSIHGRGVFATEVIAAGQVVTTWPCHVLGVLDGSEIRIKRSPYSDHLSPEELRRICTPHHLITFAPFIGSVEDARTPDEEVRTPGVKPSLVTCAQRYIWGDPQQTTNSACLAHMINASTANAGDLRGLMTANAASVGKALLEYTLNAKYVANTRFVRNDVGIYAMAVREIAAGEEILTMYALSRWIENYDARKIAQLFREYKAGLSAQAGAVVQAELNRVVRYFETGTMEDSGYWHP